MDNLSIGWARPLGSLMGHRRDGRSRIESKLITEIDVGIEMSGARDRRLRLGGNVERSGIHFHDRGTTLDRFTSSHLLDHR